MTLNSMSAARLTLLLNESYEDIRNQLNMASKSGDWVVCIDLSHKLLEIGTVLNKVEFLDTYHSGSLISLSKLKSNLRICHPPLVSFDPYSVALHYARVTAVQFVHGILEKIYSTEEQNNL